MQSNETWKELVQQVKEGARPEDALGLREQEENLSTEEFWQRLVVKGVGDTPLSFRLPDLGKLLEGAATPPREDLVVLPSCLCLDTVLQPEFALPPPSQEEDTTRFSSEPLDPEKATSGHSSSLVLSNTSLGKRKRSVSPELSSPQSSPEHSSPQPSPELVSSSDDVIDLTQDYVCSITIDEK